MTMYYPLMMYNIHKTLIDEHIDEIVDYEMTDLSEQKFVKQTLIDEHVDEIVDYEMTDLSEQFEKMGI